MTIASQTSRITYTGDGATTAFAIPFYFAANADIVVNFQDTTGMAIAQTQGTNYTLTGATVSSGGTCTFVTAPPTGYTVSIYRDPPLTQTTSYNNNDPFPAKSHETALDKLTTIAQRTKDIALRSLRLPESESNTTTTLATIANRKNKILGFGTSGELLYTTGPTFVSGTFVGVAQFDSRATAQVTTVAGSVNTIRTGGYATPGDKGHALYSRYSGTTVGGFQSADGAWWKLTEATPNILQFGVVGDGATANDAAILAAITYCVANNLTLVIPDGVYNHANTIVWAYPNFRVIASGAQAVFKHTGTGVAHSFNGQTHGSATQGVFGNVFGGPNRITLKGNPAGGTTYLAYVNNWHQSQMKIRGRDANYIIFGENTGTGAAAAVSSLFDVQVDPNGDGTAFTVTPLVGLHLSGFFGCVFEEPVVQGCGSALNPAVQVLSSSNNLFRGGTIESNSAGGLYVDTPSQSNVFDAMDLEANGAGYDIQCTGAYNIFLACKGTGTTLGQQLQGTHNKFETCIFQSVTDGGSNNVYNNCFFSVAFTDSGTNTTITNAGGFLAPISKLYLGGASLFSGAGLPTLSAPQGSIFARTDATSPKTSLYYNTNGSTGWSSVAGGSLVCGNTGTAGTVAGSTQFISPAGISTTEFAVSLIMPCAGTIDNLFVKTNGSPGAAQQWAFTLMQNAGITAITCTVTTGLNSASDTTHSITVAAGDTIDLKCVSSAGAAVTNVLWSWLFHSAT